MTLAVRRHSERRQECLVGKTENGTVTQRRIYDRPLIPRLHKNTVPVTSDGYRIFYFLYYFLTSVLFTIPGYASGEI